MASNKYVLFFFFLGFFAQHNDFDSCTSLRISAVSLFLLYEIPLLRIYYNVFHLPIDGYLVVSSLELL